VISLTGPLALGQPHHVGLVVPDIEAAYEELGQLGGGWVRVAEGREVEIRMARGKVRCRLNAAYSRLGPTHLELIQSAEGTVWDPRPDGYIHHLGYWVPADELVRRSREYEAMGIPLEATRWNEDGAPRGWAYHRWPGGFRIELVEWGSPRQLADPA
jgi:methylmalonyl-CoA/ethylmalonyl-CoA epimerase